MPDAKQLQWMQQTFKTGHFWNPSHRECWNVKYDDLPSLAIDHPCVREAIESRTRFQVEPYADYVAADHNRLPAFDGEVGPSVTRLLETDRCWVPDHAPPPGVDFAFPDDPELEQVCKQMQADAELPAVGSGNWKRCHGVGEFHSAIVSIDRQGIGSHLASKFIEVLRNVQLAYDQIGLRFVFVENGVDLLSGQVRNESPNIDFSFVQSSSGWIGLAIVGQGQTCGGRIWCRYLARYQGRDVVTEWTTLIKHELGHNCGRGHTSGGVMNPSIVSGLPLLWTATDPSYNWLRQQFGGEPVGGDNPPPPPSPPGTIETRVKQLETQLVDVNVKLAVHEALIRYLLQR